MSGGRNSLFYACVFGAFSALLGVVVMAGWYAGAAAIVQLRAGLAPMQFNTALALFLSGLALLFACRPSTCRAGILCASLVLVLAFAVGLQYVVGLDFGIDRLFVEPFIHAKTVFPGRMAPSAALCLILISLGLLVWYFLKEAESRLHAMMMTGIAVFLISFIALTGYLVKVEAAYSWWGLSDMAPQAAAGLFSLSLGLFSLAAAAKAQIEDVTPRFWAPWLAAAGGILVTFLIVQGIIVGSRNHIADMVREEAVRRAQSIQREIDRDMRLQARMREHWGVLGGMSPGVWQQDAANILRDNQTFYSLALLDNDLAALASVSAKGDEGFWRGAPLDRQALQAAAAEEKMVSAEFRPGDSARKLILFYLPLRRGGNPDGFLAGAYDIEQTLLRILESGGASSYRFELLDENGVFFTSAPAKPEHAWHMAEETDISFRGHHWKLRVIQDISGYENSGLIFLIFASGIGLSLFQANFMRQTERVRRSEELYALATGAAQVGMWNWDVEKKTVAWAGSAWEIFAAKRNEDIPTEQVAILELIGERDKVMEGVMASIEKNAAFNVDYKTKRLDGREIWVQSRGRAVEWRDGKPTRLGGTLTDVTQRKMAEEDLLRSNKELEKFAYVASHDLKAPLRGIDNLAHWVMEDMGAGLTPDAREKLGLLRSRVARLEALLAGILSYSRAGRIVESPEEIDLGALVKDVANMHLPASFSIEVGRLPVLSAPRTPFEQIFGNLLSNSVKHHDRDRGSITVSAQDCGAFYEFIVEDDGPGIPPEFQEKVFEMFQTLKPRDSTEGSGLGMAIVRKLVEWQGGRIWIVSNSGARGTAVHFLWPKEFRAEKSG